MRWLAAAILGAVLGWAGPVSAGDAADRPQVLRGGSPDPTCLRRVGAAWQGSGPHRVSAKSRRIGAKLASTGYYSYYSRALKGYPHLRSKPRDQEPVRAVAVDAKSRKRFLGHVEQVAKLYKLDPELIDAVISVESAYDPQAVSDKGALGLMQLMPGTARRFDVADPLDPVANMHGGARYLRWLMDRFDNDLDLVLAAYNAGEGALEEHGNRIPPYAETRAYVARVRRLYDARQKVP